MYDDLKNKLFHSFSSLRKLKGLLPTKPINFLESMVLSHVLCMSENKDIIKVSDLRELMDVTMPAVSQILNSLEKRGFIKREIGSSDRRSIAVTVTEDGVNALEEYKADLNVFVDSFVEKFGKENVVLLLNLLSKMSDTLEEFKKESNNEKR